jgi:DNA modification methylase
VESVKKIKVQCTGAATLPIDSIKPFQGSLKTLPKSAFAKLKKSMIDFGFSFPLFVWKHNGQNMTLDGHQRISTLQEMRKEGFEVPELPVVWIEAKDEKEAKHKLLLAVGQYGKVTDEGLYEFIKTACLEMGELNETIELGDIDFTKFLAGYGEEHELGNEPAPQAPSKKLLEKWGVKPGDIWVCGNHKIICGSSAEPSIVEAILASEKPTLIFTDPPYGVSIGDKNKAINENGQNGSGRIEHNIDNDNISVPELKAMLLKVFTLCKKHMAEDCSVFVCSPQGGGLGMMMMMMMMMQESCLEVRHIINWIKNSPTFSMGRLDYDYQHEPILFTWGKKHKKIMAGTFKTSLWECDKPRACDLHPTMKPIELYVNAILNHTETNDLVYEPFSGSGTSILACEKTNRRCRAIELDPQYVAVAIDRWSEMTGSKPELQK